MWRLERPRKEVAVRAKVVSAFKMRARPPAPGRVWRLEREKNPGLVEDDKTRLVGVRAGPW
jgi:hypothetical protein